MIKKQMETPLNTVPELEYARSYGAITRNDVIKLLKSTASRIIRKMIKNNLLKQNGKARNTNYTVIK